MVKEKEEDLHEDGKTTYKFTKALPGLVQLKTDRDGMILWRATSCSEGTQLRSGQVRDRGLYHMNKTSLLVGVDFSFVMYSIIKLINV